MITLFTFNKSVWKFNQKEIISRWGYWDSKKERQALYTTVSVHEPNRQGLQLSLSSDSTSIFLNHVPSKSLLATWDLFHIVGKFLTKLDHVLFVHADTRKIEGIEEFHYIKAELLSEPSSSTFRNGFNSGVVMIDLRMHLNPNGTVRNRGTGFRVRELSLPTLFNKSTAII